MPLCCRIVGAPYWVWQLASPSLSKQNGRPSPFGPMLWHSPIAQVLLVILDLTIGLHVNLEPLEPFTGRRGNRDGL